MGEASLAFACERQRRFGLTNLRFEHADLRTWVPANASFDYVECSGVLHHLENPEGAWARLTSLLKPGGTMLGFDGDPLLMQAFGEAMPGRELQDLGAWHELEQRQPELFIGMYELFV